MIDTKVKTQSVTNTQLAVAVLAAFMAGGLAFAALPARSPIGAQCKPLTVQLVTNIREVCAIGQAKRAAVTCPNGDTTTLVSTVCKNQQGFQAQATEYCASHQCRNVNNLPRVSLPNRQSSTGTLSIAIDTNENFIHYLTFPHNIISGEDDYVARVRLTTGPQEAVNVRSLSFDLLGTKPYLRGHISSFDIFTARDIAEHPENPIAQAHMTFDSLTTEGLNYQIPAGTTQYLYVRANTNEVNENGPTSTPPEFFMSVTGTPQVVGVSTGSDIQAQVDYASKSKGVLLVPIMITDVYNDPINTNLVGGQQELFRFKVSAYGANNRDLQGNILKVALDSLKIQMQTDIPLWKISDLRFCRIETETCMSVSTTRDLFLVNADRGPADRQGGVISPARNPNFLQTESHIIDSEETATFYVSGIINVDFGTPKYIQLKLRDLNNFGFIYTVDMNDDGRSDRFISDLRIHAVGEANYPDVIGEALT